MIDRFTKEQFEAALPTDKKTGQALWQYFGMQDGEEIYLLPVSQFAVVKIRSSINHTGKSAGVSQDSIRVWLVDPKNHKPIGPKLSKYITRVSGWETRLVNQLRRFWKLGAKIQPCWCGKASQVFQVKKEGPNQGRLFLACPGDHQDKLFEWIDG